MLILGQVHKDAHKLQKICFSDLQDSRCSLQISTYMDCTPAGNSAVWLGLEETKTDPKTGQRIAMKMHLSRVHVKALVGHLQKWLDEGSFIIVNQRRGDGKIINKAP